MSQGSKRKVQDTELDGESSSQRLHSTNEPITRPHYDSDSLCRHCAKFDFDELFSLEVKKPEGILVRRLHAFSTSSPCPLCRFFMSMRWDTRVGENRFCPEESPAGMSHLRAYSSHQLFGLTKLPRVLERVSDSVFLAVTPFTKDGNLVVYHPQYFCRTNEPAFHQKEAFSGRQLPSNNIDYMLIKSWLNLCDLTHQMQCVSKERKLVPHFRVIDCRSRKIVPTSHSCQYIALSYLWGLPETTKQSHQNEDSPPDSIPLDCPEVVEDAMEVTKQLGHRYLWVDRYCIDQNDDYQKHTQIANMDSIYSDATLTIIAAAGDDPTFGLPGVRFKPRIQQPCVTVRGTTLVSTLPNPRTEIHASKWNTRGWTYQEGLLSRRRLVFTPHQVYFQCNGMHCFESISISLQSLHISSNARFGDDIRAFRAFPSAGPGRTAYDIVSRIEEYSAKTLTYNSDVINAMLGIFKQFEKVNNSIDQLWGLPIFTGKNLQSRLNQKSFRTYSPTELLGLSLSWISDQSAKRRPSQANLPTWSCAGWTKLRSMHYPFFTKTQINSLDLGNIVFDLQIDSELHNDKLNLYRWASEPGSTIPPDKLSEYSQFLQIRAWTLKVRIQSNPDEFGDFLWTMEYPQAYRMQSWKARLSSPQKQPRFYETQSFFGNSYFERVTRGIDLDGLVLSYVTREPESEGGCWETALVILVVEPAEEKSLEPAEKKPLETSKKKCFHRLGIVTAGFQTTTPFTVRGNDDNEAFLGDTRFTRGSFRLG